MFGALPCGRKTHLCRQELFTLVTKYVFADILGAPLVAKRTFADGGCSNAGVSVCNDAFCDQAVRRYVCRDTFCDQTIGGASAK